jgi:hypothetical protein
MRCLEVLVVVLAVTIVASWCMRFCNALAAEPAQYTPRELPQVEAPQEQAAKAPPVVESNEAPITQYEPYLTELQKRCAASNEKLARAYNLQTPPAPTEPWL